MKKSISEFIKNPKINNIIYQTKFSLFSFKADPFLIEQNNQINIVYEKYSYIKKYGYIEIINTNSHKITKIIDIKSHQSFPFYIQYEDKKYIIPESQSQKNLIIYELNDDINSVINSKILQQNSQFIDSVIFKSLDTYFMFTSKSQTNSYDKMELNLLYTDDLFSQNWIPHPTGIIKSGNYGSRMAGQIFTENGKIYRFGQISNGTYGSGIAIFEIIKLSKTEYEEIFIKEINGQDFGFDGLHHISFSENYIAIDFKTHKYLMGKILLKPLKAFYKITSIMRK